MSFSTGYICLSVRHSAISGKFSTKKKDDVTTCQREMFLFLALALTLTFLSVSIFRPRRWAEKGFAVGKGFAQSPCEKKTWSMEGYAQHEKHFMSFFHFPPSLLPLGGLYHQRALSANCKPFCCVLVLEQGWESNQQAELVVPEECMRAIDLWDFSGLSSIVHSTVYSQSKLLFFNDKKLKRNEEKLTSHVQTAWSCLFSLSTSLHCIYICRIMAVWGAASQLMQ